MRSRRLLALLFALLLGGSLLTVAGSGSSAVAGTPVVASTTPASVPPVGHVFVINIENKGFDETWGPSSAAPYLSQTLRDQGVLLSNYYGTAHNSQPNYIAQLSGQGPNLLMQLDCPLYSSFVGLPGPNLGQYAGIGCVFPTQVRTLPQQLTERGLAWKGYMDDMGTPCRHPALNTLDSTQQAKVGDQYAARHNPFVYFKWITSSPLCAQRVVDLTNLDADLTSVATTPNFSYITPDLCNDGHDAPCVDGRPGGLVSVDAFLKTWVPKILASQAFQQDGMLVITADESDGLQSDSSACCGEGPSLNALLPGITGPGGGRIGALVISKWTAPDTSSDTPYNHYALLGSIEDLFGLDHLGYAATPGLARFGTDVYNAG